MFDTEVLDIIINTIIKFFSNIYQRLIKYIKQALLDIRDGIIYGLRELLASTIISLVVMVLTYLFTVDLLVKLVIAILNIIELLNISRRNIWFVTGFATVYTTPWILANLSPILFTVSLIRYYVMQTFILGTYTFTSRLVIELKKEWKKYEFIGVFLGIMLIIVYFMISTGTALFTAFYP